MDLIQNKNYLVDATISEEEGLKVIASTFLDTVSALYLVNKSLLPQSFMYKETATVLSCSLAEGH